MKLKVSVWLFSLSVVSSAFGQLTLSSGQSWSYTFDTLPYLESISAGGQVPAGTFTLSLADGTLQAGDTLQFEIFENTITDAPVYVGTMDVSSPPMAGFYTSLGLWDDLQGAIRFTTLSGEVTVDRFFLTKVLPSTRLPSNRYLDRFSTTVTPVPEPGTWALLLLGAGVGCAVARYRKF